MKMALFAVKDYIKTWSVLKCPHNSFIFTLRIKGEGQRDDFPHYFCHSVLIPQSQISLLPCSPYVVYLCIMCHKVFV